MFLNSLVMKFIHPPAGIRDWINVALRAWGLYCVYNVIRFKSEDSAWFLWFAGLLLGASAIFSTVMVASALGPVMQDTEDLKPINNLIWTAITVGLVEGCVQFLCGAAFWLPSVKNFLASHRPDDWEFDEYAPESDDPEISFGPAITMSGPEFMEWLKENESDQPPNGIGLYIKIPESLSPDERYNKYAKPIGDYLEAGELGYVDGGGTMISKDKKEIQFVGIDAVVFEREPGIAAVIEILQELKAPLKTEIHLGDEEILNVW